MPVPAFQPRRPAFTLIELVVVVVILGVAAAAIVPRFVGGSARSAEVSATGLREVISAVATRSALSGQRVAIDYDGTRRTAEAIVWRNTGAADDWTALSRWVVDPLTPAAQLTDARVSSVTSDGVNLDPSRWRVEFAPGIRRPAISVTVAQADGPRAWRIHLPTGAMRAELIPDRPGEALAGAVIDLDASGHSEEAW